MPPLSDHRSHNADQKYLTLIAIAACISYALTEPLLSGFNQYIRAVVVGATLFAISLGDRNRDLLSPFVFFLIATGLEITSWLASFQATDFQFQPNQFPQIEGVGKWFWFIPLVFWLQKKAWAPATFWAVAIFAFTITPWILGDGFSEIELAIEGNRIDAGTRNAQHGAMYAGLVLIGAFCLLMHSTIQPAGRSLLFTISLCMAAVALFFIYATQTRAIWLGSICAVVTILIIYSLSTIVIFGGKIKKRHVTLLIGLLMLAGIWAVTHSPMSSKIDRESSTASLVMQGRISEVPLNSSGIRVRSWYYALPWLNKHLWFGWGPDGSKLIMQESDALPEKLKKKYGHLHNTYLDLVAQYGLAGLAFYLGLLAWFFNRLIKAYRSQVIPPAGFLFGIGFLVYWLIINTFESYMMYSSGKYAFSIVFAGIFSLMRAPKSSANPAPMKY